MIDRDELRRLALIARDDDQPTTCAAGMTASELRLAQALDPETVLALLDEAKTERASFEAACDAAEELDARLEQKAAHWRGMAEDDDDAAVAAARRMCAADVRALLKERR